MTSRRVIALIVGALTLVGGSLSAATASAAAKPAAKAVATAKAVNPKGNVQLPGPVSQTPLTYTPNVYAGNYCGSLCKTSTIHSTVVVNGEVVVAGVFGNVCTPAPATYAQCPSTVPADYIFAYNPATGAIDPNFNPTFNDPVYSLAAGPNNTVYAGGAFTSVDGTTANHLAEIYVDPGQSDDGTVVPGFSATTSAAVNAIALNGNALYVGGAFSSADGVTTSPITRLNAATGAVDSKTFKFKLSDPAVKPLDVKTLSLSPDGSTLVIAGSFLQVNGQAIPRLAMISTGGGLGEPATLDNFSVPELNNNCSAQHDYINGVDFSPDGSFFVIADTGYEANGQPGLCDEIARFNTDESDSTDATPAWVNYTGGDSFRSVVVAGSVVYAGGHQRWLNNQCGNNNVCSPTAVQVGGIGAIDANTGYALPWWHPMTSRGIGVQSLATYPAGTFSGSDGGLILGTDVSSIAGVTHNELAMFPMTSTATPASGGPILNGMFSDGWLGGLDESYQGVADMCIDDAGNSSTPGTTVDLATCDNSVEQDWTMGSGQTIQINGLCMDTQSGGTTPGTQVVLNTCDNESSQVWTQGSGDTVLNQASGLCLDDPNSSTTSGVVLDINTCDGVTSQSWPLPVAQASPPPPPNGLFYTSQGLPGDAVPCMSDEKGIQTQGNAVIIQDCEGYAWQNWTLESNGTIQFKGRCLDTSDSGTSQGTNVVLDKCTTATSQVWQVGSNQSVVNPASGLCLNNPGDSAGVQLNIYSCNGSYNQRWWLPEV